MNTSGKSHIGKILAQNLKQLGYNARYTHAFSQNSNPGRLFYKMGFFENPVLQTKLLLEDIHLRVFEDFASCDVGIIDRYLTSTLIYQTNKAFSKEERKNVEQLIQQKSAELPRPMHTFVLEISYETLCRRYLNRYGKPPKLKHVPFIQRVINDFASAPGTHLDNNENLEQNIRTITEISTAELL